MTGVSSIGTGGEHGQPTVPGEIPRDSADPSQFSMILQNSAREAVRSALGDVILGILTGQNMLQNLANSPDFTERLRRVFGSSGAKTLQFVIMKELYKQLNLSFEPDGVFDYGVFLQDAKKSFSKRRARSE